MNLRLTALSALVGISLAAFALPSNACFTVIVGKKVSSTGEILVGHNEDNEMRIITSQYWVDPAVHEDGELIEFEPAAAKIPQVKKTLGDFSLISLKYANGLRNGANSDTHRCKQLTEHGEERCNKLREVAGFSAVRTIFQIVGPRKILHCLLGK